MFRHSDNHFFTQLDNKIHSVLRLFLVAKLPDLTVIVNTNVINMKQTDSAFLL